MILIILIQGEACKFKCKYGLYCYKRRRNHLIKDNMIDIDNFTGLSKDYLKGDLLYYQEHKMKNKSTVNSKQKLFDEIKEYINSLKDMIVKKITKI